MFIIEVPYFNLNNIYNSLQCPRWIKLKDMKYIIPFKDKALKIEQHKNRLVMNCSEDEFYNVWFEYFDLRTDYMLENQKIKKLGGKFRIPANRGKGIHILRQDTFETFVFCFIAETEGYVKAKYAMNHIAEVCGVKHVQSMREAGKVVWYEWPTPEMILENFDNLKKMGKVNDWLKNACEILAKEGLDVILDESEIKLFQLLGLHEKNIFPLNGIKDILAKNFDCDPEEFADWYLDEIENKGLAYMYILHHIINKPKEVILSGLSR